MQNQRIIVCGPDKCGKTTFVNLLESRLGIKSYKSKKEKGLFHEVQGQYNMLKWVVPELIELISQFDINIVFDRFIPCEYAYAKTFNRFTDTELIFKYDKQWNDINGKIIFIWRSTPFAQDDVIDNFKYHSTLISNYNEYLVRSKCKFLSLENNTTIEEGFNTIQKFLND